MEKKVIENELIVQKTEISVQNKNRADREREWECKYIIFDSSISVVLGTEISTIEYHISRSKHDRNVRSVGSESALLIFFLRCHRFFFIFSSHSSPRCSMYMCLCHCFCVCTVYRFIQKNCITYIEYRRYQQ